MSTPAARSHHGPSCRACGGPADPRKPGMGIFCGECWTEIVPASRRDDITRASTALGRRPTSTEARKRFDTAVYHGVRIVRERRRIEVVR